MTATKPKTVLKGKLNKPYLVQCLKINLLFSRPFRFIYSPLGWQAYSRYDRCTANLPKDLDIVFERSLRTALETAHKQIKLQLPREGKLAKKLEGEADQWALLMLASFKRGVYSPLKWSLNDVMKKTDCSRCHAYPLKDFSASPSTKRGE